MRKIITIKPADKSKTDFQNKQFIHQSSRPIGTDTFYTGTDDNGAFIEHLHGVNDEASDSIYVDFTVINNITYVHEALCQWKDAVRDTITAEVVPELTTYVGGSDTIYNIDPGSGFIIPAAGNGVITPDVIKLVHVGYDQDTRLPAMPGYWDCGLNEAGDGFNINTLTPNLTGKGKYNMMTVEFCLARFVRQIPLMGTTSAWNVLPSSDTARLSVGQRLKLIFETRGASHAWEAAVSLVMHREKLQ